VNGKLERAWKEAAVARTQTEGKKPQQNSVKISGVQAEIRTQNLPITNMERYLYFNTLIQTHGCVFKNCDRYCCPISTRTGTGREILIEPLHIKIFIGSGLVACMRRAILTDVPQGTSYHKIKQ
jgi:hypothetical protein